MLNVMTFNLRFQNEHDGQNAWKFRRSLVAGIINKYRPALIGTQEGTAPQLRDLLEIDRYDLYAPTRFWDETCQYCSLFYRNTELRPVSACEFWLSSTPEVHRSVSWDSAFPRMISCAVFEEIESGKTFWAGVTHLDHIGSVARVEQGRIIREFLQKQPGPRILMGDFNDRPRSAVHALLTVDSEIMDTWELLRRAEDESGFTYHGFQGVPKVFRMDWILVSLDFAVQDAMVIYDHGPDGRYPSDHFPYMARLGWLYDEGQHQNSNYSA